MDVKTTFFYGHLHEKIYMAQLQGYADPKYLKIYSNAYMVWSNHQGCDMNALIIISSLILDFIKKW